MLTGLHSWLSFRIFREVQYFSLQWMVLVTQNTIEMIKKFKLALWTHVICLHCYSSWWLSWSGLRRPEAQEHWVALLLTEHLQGKAEWQWAGSILCSFCKREKQTDLHNVQSTHSNRDGFLLRGNVCGGLANVLGLPVQKKASDHRENPNQGFSDCSKPFNWQVHKQFLPAIWFVWPISRGLRIKLGEERMILEAPNSISP